MTSFLTFYKIINVFDENAGRRFLKENLHDGLTAYGKRILATVSQELRMEFGERFIAPPSTDVPKPTTVPASITADANGGIIAGTGKTTGNGQNKKGAMNRSPTKTVMKRSQPFPLS